MHHSNGYYKDAPEQLVLDYARAQAFTPAMLAHIPATSTILDIGCGSGRDIAFMLKQGHTVHGVDPCRQLLDAAQEYYPEIKGLVHHDSLPGLKTIRDSSCDVVTCNAVLMHLPEDQLADSVHTIRRVLKNTGRAFVSIPGTRDDVDPDTKQDTHGRYFNGAGHHEVQKLFEQDGFRQTDIWFNRDGLGRKGVTWVTMLFTLGD